MATESTVRYLRRMPFNMIEVVLALSVVAIGMLAILGLIPIGTKATRDAIGTNYAADRADFLLHYIATRATASSADWDTFIAGASPLIPAIKTEAHSSAGDINNTSTWTHQIEDLYYTSAYPDTTTNRRAYRFQALRVREGTEVVDFDGVVTVWTSQTSSSTYDSGSGTWQAFALAPLTERAQVNAEVSWPATLQYQDRNKMSFSLEVVAP